MLVIEGGDLVGKTTLCYKLNEHLTTHAYQHLSKLYYDFNPVIGYIDLASRFSIKDRFHISEAVYADVTERDTQVTPNSVRLLEAHLRLLGMFTVIVTADDCLLEERFNQHKAREMYDLETILRVNERFKIIGSTGRWMGYQFDVDEHIHCTRNNPWPTTHTSTIAFNYQTRQQILEVHL